MPYTNFINRSKPLEEDEILPKTSSDDLEELPEDNSDIEAAQLEPKEPIEESVKNSEVDESEDDDKEPAVVASKQESKKPTPVPTKEQPKKEENKLEEAELTEKDLKGTPSEFSTDKLKQLQENAKEARGYRELAQAGSLIGSGIAGATPETTERLSKHFEGTTGADQEVTNYLARVQTEKMDPNSSFSVGFRDFVKDKLGFQLPDTVSGVDAQNTYLKPLLNMYTAGQAAQIKAYSLERNIQSREAIAKDKLESATTRQKALDEQRALDNQRKDEQASESKRFHDIIGDRTKQQKENFYAGQLTRLNKDLAEGVGPAGKKNIQNILGSYALFNTVQYPGGPQLADKNISSQEIDRIPNSELNKIPPNLISEMALEANRLLTQSGAPAQGTFEKLLPKNAEWKLADAKQWVSSSLQPGQQGDFVRQFLHLGARLRDQARENNTDLMQNRLGGTAALYQNNPKAYDSMVKQLELDPNQVHSIIGIGPEVAGQKSSMGKPLNIEQKAKDSEALDWAKDKLQNGTPSEKQDALSILKANGVL